MAERLSQRIEKVEKPTRHVSQIAVIDFDRTLGDVDASMKRFYNAADFIGVNADRVQQAQSLVESDGGTFEPLSYIKDQLDETGYEAFKEHFITANGPSIMYPEAQPFLNMLSRNNLPFVVRTWGVSAEWQHLKIAASGYTGPYEVMDTKDKGAEIESWRKETPEGKSILLVPDTLQNGEKVIADSAVLVDDKALSFKSLDEKCKGFWIIPANGEHIPSQQGNVPPNVEKVTLNDLTVEDGKLIKKELPDGMHFSTELTDKHIDQLVEFSTDLKNEDIQNNTSDAKRFKDREAVLKWIEKGRCKVVITDEDGDLLGIAWKGAEDIDIDDRELKIAFNPSQHGITFAIRTYEKARGKGLSVTLAQKIDTMFEQTEAHQKLVSQGKAGTWLEVSALNEPAVRSYLKNGYIQVTEPNEDGKILMVQKAKPSETLVTTK